jgi:hypothetical protein
LNFLGHFVKVLPELVHGVVKPQNFRAVQKM